MHFGCGAENTNIVAINTHYMLFTEKKSSKGKERKSRWRIILCIRVQRFLAFALKDFNASLISIIFLQCWSNLESTYLGSASSIQRSSERSAKDQRAMFAILEGSHWSLWCFASRRAQHCNGFNALHATVVSGISVLGQTHHHPGANSGGKNEKRTRQWEGPLVVKIGFNDCWTFLCQWLWLLAN